MTCLAAIAFAAVVSDGIGSSWIPYGTYTDKVGGTEYFRIPTNFVATIFDGWKERKYVPAGTNDYVAFPDSRRIVDVLNRGVNVSSGVEGKLAITVACSGRGENGGVAASFGSRALDSLCEDAAPPVSAGWNAALPFDPAASNDWRFVYPTYAACTNDIHFYHTNGLPHRWPRQHILDWSANGWWASVAGSDCRDAATNLCAALESLPITNVVEDVLGIDTGWEYYPTPTNDWWFVNGVQLFRNDWEFIDTDFSREDRDWYWDSDPDEEHYYLLGRIASDRGQWVFQVYDYDADHDWYYISDEIEFQMEPWNKRFSVSTEHGTYTGVKTTFGRDDYTHWRNGTRRVDRKRLGILCQLERHMETTFKARKSEDEALPLYDFTATAGHYFSANPGAVDFAITTREDGTLDATCLDNSSAWTWDKVGEHFDVTTNYIGRSYPTARAARPRLSGGIYLTATAAQYTLARSEAEYVAERLAAWTDPDTNGVHWGMGKLTRGGGTLRLDCGMPNHDGHGNPILDSIIAYLYSKTWTAEPGIYSVTCDVVSCGVVRNASACCTVWSSYVDVISALERPHPAFPSPGAWADGYVARVNLPAVEVMVSVTNDGWCASTSADLMPYDQIAASQTNGVERVFRLGRYGNTNLSSSNQLDNTRAVYLNDLNQAVQAKFASRMSGTPQDVLGSAVGIVANDKSAILFFCSTLDSPASAAIEPGGNQLFFRVRSANDFDLSWTPGGSPIPTDAEGNFIIGELVIQVANEMPGAAVNSPSCRVDGHVNQLIKTLWRFKNLRDPSL